MTKPSAKLVALLILVITIPGCGGGGGDGGGNNPPPVSIGKWAWMSGSNYANQWGVYGTKGTPAPSNVPRSREGGVSWVDAQGNLWLFGGFRYGSSHSPVRLNDLWRYDPATSEWTWISGSSTENQAGIYGIKGTADPLNVPGARDWAVSWVDATGRLWLFGGQGYDSAGMLRDLNDVWNYDPATLEWTWLSGSDAASPLGVYGTKGIADSQNDPGARNRAVGWVDLQGKFWLFGGYGGATAGNLGTLLNDLWSCDPGTSVWTWISGSDTVNQAGVYGIKGTAALSNVPGARAVAVSWVDSSGELWLFGGHGRDPASSFTVDLNDLWKFDTVTLEWTWMSGSDIGSQHGVYGKKGTAASSNVPGARGGSISWVDSQGKLWLFGGWGKGSTSDSDGPLNDLWTHDPASSEWTWMSGSHSTDQAGFYGAKGTASSSNVPGARYRALSWVDSSGKLWLFGGSGCDSTGGFGYLNDLWKYTR